MPPIVQALIGILLLLGVAITVWVFVPAFQGREAAQRAVGSHRLALGSIVALVTIGGALTLAFRPFLQLDSGLTAGTFVFATAITTQIPMLLIVYVRLVMPGVMSWQDLGLQGRPVEFVLRLGLGGGLVGFVVNEIVINLLSQVGLRPNQLDQFDFVLHEGRLAFSVLLVSAGILAPFVEELFFRGFIFGAYRRTKPLWLAYVASSVLFTALHLEPNRMNVPQMAGLSIGIFTLAMLLAWLYARTGSLYSSMIAHALNNTTGLILFYTVGAQ